MGYWFSKYFDKKGVRVSAYDIDVTSLKPSNNMTIYENFSECVETADLVLVCVPVKNTPSATKKCASKMKSGAILAEISSLKHQAFKTLEKISTDIKPLCIHPMFGPGTMDIKQMKILLIPVKNEENELKILNDIFEGAIITVIPDANIHDELIAIVLGLTHYVNIIFASFLSQENSSNLPKNEVFVKTESALSRHQHGRVWDCRPPPPPSAKEPDPNCTADLSLSVSICLY